MGVKFDDSDVQACDRGWIYVCQTCGFDNEFDRMIDTTPEGEIFIGNTKETQRKHKANIMNREELERQRRSIWTTRGWILPIIAMTVIHLSIYMATGRLGLGHGLLPLYFILLVDWMLLVWIQILKSNTMGTVRTSKMIYYVGVATEAGVSINYSYDENKRLLSKRLPQIPMPDIKGLTPEQREKFIYWIAGLQERNYDVGRYDLHDIVRIMIQREVQKVGYPKSLSNLADRVEACYNVKKDITSNMNSNDYLGCFLNYLVCATPTQTEERL